MSYLQPPQNSAPVVVVKDVGGYVNEYAAMTDFYRRTNREVRLHECRSACTMALSLPNVCVYPDSLLKFHQAYDPRNHVTNWAATDALFQTYPEAVRLRLGTPTKGYTVLRGSELIELGVRNCNEPGPRIMIAQASIKPIPQGMFSGSSGLSSLTGKLEGMLPGLGTRGDTSGRPTAKPAAVPLPPEKPAEIVTADLGNEAKAKAITTTDGVSVPVPFGGIPMPPPRPKVLVAFTPALAPIPLNTPIDGSYPVLPARFTPFRKLAS